MTLTAGLLLHERYRINHLIARGGFGAVYLAYDITLQRTCAVKENLASEAAAQTQFEQEALILARLHHPNLPRVIDHFVIQDQGQYLVMDYVEGKNLAEIMRIQGHPFAQIDAIPIALEVCAALQYLHSQQPPIIHRDIKPQNIIITPSDRVMLVDFGLSKVLAQDVVTVPGARGMTPGYSAPEQYGLAPTEPASDVYALGATLYTMLTGQRPPDALRRLTEDLPVPSLRTFNTTVTPQVERSVMAALEPSVTRRLPTVEAFSTQLTKSSRVGGASRARRVWLVAMALGLVVFVGVPVVTALGQRLLQPTKPVATPTTSERADQQPPPVASAAVRPRSRLASRLRDEGATLPSPTPAPSPTQGNTPTAVVVAVQIPVATETATATATPAPTPLGGGRRVAFVSDVDGNQEIYVASNAGSELTNVTNHPSDDAIPAWSPDGRLLAFESNRDGNWEIYVMDPTVGEAVRVTNDPAEDHDPDWSPDGRSLLFHSNRSGVWQLYTLELETGDIKSITQDPAGAWGGSWSPDGLFITYSQNYPGPAEIYTIGIDGTNPVNLTNSRDHESAVHWSPNGERLVFYSERDGNREIYSMRPDGSAQTRLTSDPANDRLANWSLDGAHLVFTSNRAGSDDLYILDPATGAVNPLLQRAGNDSSPDWGP
ncbi:MAG: PD40 domain-containing protein [Anaerolineales bacterium]|nr:PD40 domain-containing protein [Anaerolineales bacterium]